jgi:hypothetical protein
MKKILITLAALGCIAAFAQETITIYEDGRCSLDVSNFINRAYAASEHCKIHRQALAVQQKREDAALLTASRIEPNFQVNHTHDIAEAKIQKYLKSGLLSVNRMTREYKDGWTPEQVVKEVEDSLKKGE